MRALALVVIAALAAPAAADPLDEFGFGARATGMAGAYSASAHGVDAAHHNAAGVALAAHPAVMLGYGYGAMQLELNGDDAEVLDARGTSLGFVLPLDFDDTTVAFGLAMYYPDQFIARIQLIPATEPHFALLDNDVHRIVVEPVLAVRLRDKVAIGAGVSLLTNVAGNGITFNVGVTAGEKVGEAALDVTMPTRVAPLVGLLVMPVPRARFAATYRAALGLDLALDILANVDVANVVTGDTLVSLRSSSYYTPQRATGGIAVDALPDLTLSADVAWVNWSAAPSGVADLRVLVDLDTAPPLVGSDVPEANFEDIVELRVGAEWRFGSERTQWAARAGYAYLPSPVPDQLGLTSFADNDRHVLALGAGVTLADWKPVLTRPIGFEVAAQWHHLADRLTIKDAEMYPGQPFSSAGNIFYVSSTMKVAF